MLKVRSLALVLAITVMASMASLSRPAAVAAAENDEPPTATLDGRPIPLADVSKYYCDDFAYPEIRCSTSKFLAETRATVAWLLSGVDYVSVFDGSYFLGSFMNISQDYPVLGTIGWNDKISSFKGRNGETGKFTTDWFGGGSSYTFCCNSQVATLGSYDNTFSSVQRT